MRTKPDVSGFELQAKDPTAFLDGADGGPGQGGDAPGTRTVTIKVTKPEPVVQKLFRLRWETSEALKAGAAQESATLARRVTETEIVERLLRKHYELD